MYHSIAYFLSNISAKNYQNRLMFVEVIASQSSVVFETQRILGARPSHAPCPGIDKRGAWAAGPGLSTHRCQMNQPHNIQ